ncbi:protocadherin-23 isoform X1 [Acipenser ruthenus]|uniref:protocadherin-23 isoform X1 n=1 Tax=Acipenser ruthenus TaxID=7906 RepID=UPI0027421CC4|nr:protocadherin-23 isoform X1 [Acipenser ruthenus]
MGTLRRHGSWTQAFVFLKTIILIVLSLCNKSSAQVHNLSLSIEEGLPAGTIVGDIRTGLPKGTPNSGFFISESRESYFFKDLDIDGDTGIISTAKALDRESRGKYEFVAATLTGEMVQVEILVIDVNDHSPVFPKEKVQLNISEQSPSVARFQLEGALDLDEGEFGIQGYRITEGDPSGIFRLEYRSGSNRDLSLDLILSGKLDRESTDFYSLGIKAFDGGNPPKTGHLQVDIVVLDENDNPPVFNQAKYEVLVWENAPLTASVCQVYATDQDLGSNGNVIYEINRRQSDPNELFVIDNRTGVISLNKPLDYENQPFHELIIQARDDGAQPEYSSTFVLVKVLDINDNSPTINIMFLSESGEPEVSEGASIGDYVARISVSDPDLGEHLKVHVSLEGGDGKFILKPSDDFLYFLCVNGSLDREKLDLYELRVVASDFGVPPLWSEKTFLVTVTDINDSPPMFEQDIFTVNVSEAASRGTALLQVHAKDSDEGISSVVYYTVVNILDTYLFAVDSMSGLITTVSPLDHETQPLIHLLVVATDAGSPPLSSTATITVHVEDVNDNEPVFEHQVYNASVREHSPVGSCFLQVTATDADSDDFGKVRYSLYDRFNNYEKSHLLRMDTDSGQVCISQDIDRDGGLANFDVLVKAEDGGGLSAQAYIHIEVEDVNDNRPVFNPLRYITSISSHTQPGTEVLNVVAADRDAGTNGRVSYELVPGDLSFLFTVDTSTGILYLTSTLSHLGSTSVKLSVSAQDGGGLSSLLNAVVTVNILRSALAPAVFERLRYAFAVPEDAKKGTAVGTVRATTPSNSLESLSYRISSGDPNGLFSIHPAFGMISTNGPLDHESQPCVILMVQSQTGSSPVYSSTQVNITIIDVNDNQPVFHKESETITVSQNTLPGTVLYIAHAEDRDSGHNGRIRYALQTDNTKVFTIDVRHGTVYLNRSLSQGTQPRYLLKISAEDEGDPPQSSVFTLVVNIDRTKLEDTLAFETLIYQVEISENAQTDTRLIQVRAHGQDPQTYSSLSYSLQTISGSPVFGIHLDSGWIYLRQSLNYESTSTYKFKVSATAMEERMVLQATATVTVNVLDENDNAPVFSQESYFFTIQEGPVPCGLVGSVKAADIDSGKNAQLSYILLSEGKYFRINSKTGEIINWVALDREQRTHHTLSVLVTDQGVPRLNATTTIYIIVTDINDNPPQFTHMPTGKEIHVQVWAGQAAGTVVATLFAKDLDAGDNGTVQYTLNSDDGLGHFEIDSKTGEMKTTERLLQSSRSRYRLTVTAMDKGPSPLEASAVVHVQIIPVDKGSSNNAEHIIRHFVIKEDSKPGKVIGSLKLPNHPNESNQMVDYSISEGDGSVHFGVDRSTGDLHLAYELDYETASHYLLKVQVEDHSQAPVRNTAVFVSVSVEDVNDHSPWFLDDFVVIGIQENLPAGSWVYTFNAKDGDGSLPNSALRYHVTSSSMEETPFVIDPVQGTLTTTALLDREDTHTFILTVTATDQVVNLLDRKTCSLTAKIVILDVNDNSPVFVSSHISYVMEDAEVGSLVHHTIAQDKDEGRNGRVTYSVLSGNEKGVFLLEETTGLLSLSSSLDYEALNSYSLSILACDSGSPALSSTQTLTVSVVDVNDQAPMFKETHYNASVPENHEPGEFVIRVAAVDRDSEANAAVCFTLLPGSGHDLFTINSQTGEITTKAVLDREVQDHFSIRVLARDSGLPALSSTATVLCTVLDLNDNTPEFILPTFEIKIPENQEPGIIYTALASDEDAGENGIIEYGLVDENAGGYFVINSTTGALSATKALDREERCNYTIVIEARDLGTPQRSSTAELRITVLDVNDNSPEFSKTHYRTSVSEDLAVGSEVLQLTATDKDEGSNGEVMYSLIDDTFGMFTISSSTGTIMTTMQLDRETKSQYMFRAVANDCSTQGPRSSTVNVMVHIEDINDNAPVFIQNPVNGQVSMETALNQTIATVRADDSDLGQNGAVVFSFAEPDLLFDINRQTGDIWLKSLIPSSEFGTKVLHVIAADQGIPVQYSSGLVIVHLQVEETGIWFTEPVYKAAIPENSKSGSMVVTVTAHDRNKDTRKIKYSIFSGNENEAFTINADTGDISIKDHKSLDFEMQDKIHLVVLAENTWKTAHCRITITIQDVNDNPPRFEQSYYKTAVWEGQIYNTYIMQVFATDADSGLNGQIEYSILSGNQNDAFLIDTARGIVATNAILDREIFSSYKLILLATDKGSPQLTATTTMRIQVVDVNDNAPAIPPMEPAEIAENLPAGYIVTQVSANDVDLSPALSYSFADNGNPGGKFAIDRYTGVITLTESLDYEESPQYVLQIRASDSIHETGAELRVHVLDVNDNPPVFSQESYQVLLAELTPRDTFVLALSTTDRDSGLNGEVSYRLLSSASKGFYISLKNGSLFTSKPLRYFMESSVVQLLVEASDGGDPALTAVTSVEIQIRDINDHAPQFMQATFQVSVSEAAAVGSTVLYLSASDQDFSHENYYLDYSIFGGNEQNRFCIETSVLQADDEYKTVGKLVLCNPLDRENTMNYTLVVVASDRGTPPLNASAVVSVTVIDANDNPPVFSQLEYHIQVSESIPLGSRLTEVSAHDPDEGVNAEIRFHIVSGNDKGHFRLDHRSGAVELNQSLDYEENAKFTLTVQAIDSSSMGSRKMAFAVLFITVLDENDNSPYFIFPAMNCSILENQTAFTHVCSLYAVDHDSGPFGQVTYSILSPCSVDYGSPNKKEAFAIDSLTGDIYSKQTFDYERENRYCFVVQAKDKGDQTATIKVQVDIESVDEFSPVFTPTEYYFQLPENSEVGQSIGQVSAVDSDGGVDGVLVYSLAESSRFFSVNRTSGTVYLTSAVYRKKGSVKKREDLIEFKVKASSPKLDSKSESCIVIVNISNSAEAFTGMQLNSLTISLTISFVVFLLSAIILVGLILRFRRKDVKVKTRTVDSMATTLNHSISDTLEKSNGHRQSTIVLQDLAEQVDIRDKKEVINPCRHSGSSGRGSADGDTAEDEEIKMINEHPCRKGSGSALSERASRVPDSGIPQDSDQLSCQSEEADLAATTIATVADSSESIYHFKEEGGGEGCDQNYISNEVLSRRFTGMAIKEKDLLAHSTKGYIFHTDDQSSAGASLTSLVSVEEELRGSYNWDYLMNWEPRFQPLASVFTDIAELQDNGLQKPNIAQESRGIIYPPPLITSVAQPGIRAVPPRLPTFTNRAAFPKYTHSPLTGNSGLTPSAMTPSFSPSLSLLTMQTPTSSPVISETGITGPPKRATLHPSTLGEEEMQV